MEISTIIEAVRRNRIKITEHADEEVQSDKLKYEEIIVSVLHGEVIEDYPKDRPYPGSLIYGETFINEPIHSVWAYNEETKWAVLITVYRPDPELWINDKKRRKKP